MKIETKLLNKKMALDVHDNVQKCQQENKYGCFLPVYDKSIYEEANNFGIYRNNTLIGGFSIADDGELFSMYKLSNDQQLPYISEIIFSSATEEGAKKFYCFGDYLPKVAYKYGFCPICKMDFFYACDSNESGWDYHKFWDFHKFGTPQMYFCKKIRLCKTEFSDYDRIIPTINKFDNATTYRDYCLEE